MLPLTMQGYTIDNSRPIGQGSFGQVFRGKHRKTNQIVAIKKIRFNMMSEGVPGLGIREISNLRAVAHKRVAKLLEAEFCTGGFIYIIMEYADIDLARYVKAIKNNHDGAAMPEPLIQRLSRHLFKGLAHLHTHGMIHRDLKPGNILIDAKQCLKIADFGLSRIQSLPGTPMSFEASTLPYRPPEILLGELLHAGSYDMWSAGCIVAEMARAGGLLFRGSRSLKVELQLEAIFKNLGTPDEEIWPGVGSLPGWKEFPMHEPKSATELFPGLSGDGMDFVLQCLFYPPQYRISARRALIHPWLNKHVPACFPEELAGYYIDDAFRQNLLISKSPAMAPTHGANEESIVERVHTFVGENRRVVIGAAVVAAAGVGYYVYSRSSGGDKSDKKKPSKDKKKKSRRTDQADGPILEERNPVPDESEIKALPIEERLKRSADLKSRGNSAYTQRNFELAVDLYSQAIAMSPKPEAVFYSNRAACYTNFKPPQHQKVIEDCTQALKLDPKYAKALNRRATALEAIDNLKDALRDFTALAIIERFKNDAASASVERVLAKLSTKQAEEIMRGRAPRLPSVTFISAYFAAFRQRPNVILPDYATAGDHKLLEAQEALAESQFAKAHELVNTAIDSGLSDNWKEGLAEALNLRGTFKFLMGDTAGAKEDFLGSTQAWPDLVQSWVKIASVYMELSEAEAAFAAFESAIEKDSNCADIYYHRGQVFFILSDFERAADDYRRSSELDPGFVFSHIQLAVAQYKMMDLDSSMSSFRSCLLSFPNRGEPYNYYGELLLDQQRFQEAVEKFDRAIEIERQKKTLPNPLPLVNKALALYQWKQDLASATQLCKEALTLDDECDAAVATLAQLSLQQGRVEEAIEMFTKHASIARTEAELVQALSYQNASQAQLEFQKNYPDMAGQLAAMAQGMQPF
ncbi:unnamed protein product [Rhizoctonia solani]|uniref:Protein kinase domain-containing protein n=1 Tax=Rhizoctonia solani TaxID=456999 RepID=A0A8H2X480_9AGAM|nr:unnamed protein product [Rhizoctonia solani]